MNTPNFDIVFIDLRLRLLESILLQEKSAHTTYLEELNLLRSLINSEGGAGKEELLSLIEQHITYIKTLPTH